MYKINHSEVILKMDQAGKLINDVIANSKCKIVERLDILLGNLLMSGPVGSLLWLNQGHLMKNAPLH